MDDIGTLLTILFWLIFVIGLVTLIGHGIWVLIRFVVRQVTGHSAQKAQVQTLGISRCPNCDSPLNPNADFCGHCGFRKPVGIVVELLKDLAATERQLERFHRASAIDDAEYERLREKIQAEKARLGRREPKVPGVSTAKAGEAAPTQPRSVTTSIPDEAVSPIAPPSVVVVAPAAKDVAIVIESETAAVRISEQTAPFVQIRSSQQPPESSPPSPPHKPFAEVLAAFMEQSNIRWGEIIGGLLIIGCSTALVVSLWAQISRIPVLKFLIFTTVTAALFGVGLYTEHRWKLPTTSRGILTIATLLVPLNFLAIAAVSGSTIPPGALVIGSELVAPALFLCLVYFAGRVLTAKWPHLLAAGVLGSSVGQLLIRHFASPDDSPILMLMLGGFPVICYVAAGGWMLRIALEDDEIDEGETTAIFTTLGAITFAAVLPFGLLLYKSGPVSLSMMYLAPLVTLGGVPMLASGALLWRRVTKRELLAYRTAGTSIAIAGTAMVLAGMILAWPNPASIVPAALFNFAVFTALAVWLEIPAAHLLAAGCLALAYLVLSHVLAGDIHWQNLRVLSLLNVMITISSGQALAAAFVVFLGVAEWLARRQRAKDSTEYVIAACGAAVVSLFLITEYGFGVAGDPDRVWLFYLLYGCGAFWIGWRRALAVVSFCGSALLLLAFGQALGPWLQISFPWQAALLAHASVCAAIAILFSRNEKTKNALARPLNTSALVTSSLVVAWVLLAGISLLFSDAEWQPAPLLAQRVLWLTGIWFVLLWLNRHRALFAAFQTALTLTVVLAIKAFLQRYDWYAYFPYAALHPLSLEIQGSALAIVSIGWVGLRLYVRHLSARPAGTAAMESESAREAPAWVNDAAKLLNDPKAIFGRPVMWLVLGGFVLLALYGAVSGVRQELSARWFLAPAWNIAGFPHKDAYGAGAWILLAFLIIAFLANLWEQRRSVYLLGAATAAAMVCPLLAARWETEIATASAWRWLTAIFLIFVLLALWLRDEIAAVLESFGWPPVADEANELARKLRVLLSLLSITPLLVLTIQPTLRAIYYLPIHGPSSGFFAWLHDGFSYSVPPAIAALVLIGFGIRERLVRYAFTAGLLFNVAVTVAYLLSVAAARGNMDRVVLIHVVQLNAIASALYTIVWLSVRKWWREALSDSSTVLTEELLKVQLGIAIFGIALVIVPAAIRIIIHPGWASAGIIATGSIYGWLAFNVTAIATAYFGKAYKKRVRPDNLCALLAAISCLFAFNASPWNPANWSGFHTLMLGVAASAWLMSLARLLPARLQQREGSRAKSFQSITTFAFTSEWSWNTALFATILGAVTVMLALRCAPDDPSSPWWSIGALLAMCALAAALHWQTLRRPYLYAAGVIFNTAVGIWLLTSIKRPPSGTEFVEASVIALCWSSIIWLWLELRARRLVQPQANRSTALSFHNPAALLSLLVMALLVSARTLEVVEGGLLSLFSARLDWSALISVAALMLACLWDKQAKYAVAGLYLIGMIGAAMVLDQMHLSPQHLGWAAMMVMAIYTVVVSLVWRQRAKLLAWTDQLRIPRRVDPEVTELKWLQAFNALLISVVILLAYWIDLRFYEWPLRITTSLAVAIQALALALIAPAAGKDHEPKIKDRVNWQRAAFAMFTLGLVFFGWSWLTPGINATWLNRAVILMVEMFTIVALFGLELDRAIKREPEWTRAIRDCVPWLTVAGIVSLCFVLSTEIYYQIQFGSVRINVLALITTGVTLAAATVICVLFALSPKHDPLSLPEVRRRRYVYAAEVMLALLFMHIRLTMPWLFTGFFERYWPLVVVAIAYLGIAASEMLRRRKVLVLAHPIERTGVFLPLLPVLGFWLMQSQVDYSVLLFIIGGLYGLLSILRRSFVFGILAALASNGGLWYLWHRTEEYGFIQHPQLWLIPAACSVLVAAYLNREDFSEEQLIGVRYLALVTIYVSSTADIFINGVANSPWLPMILAAISVIGVFCGIMFRIRAFLILGSVFLLLAITTMIYYASVNLGWTWLWYVAGIVTGAMIIFTFALFEKKRDDMLRVVEGLKEWQR
jgi:hypothetical protein